MRAETTADLRLSLKAFFNVTDLPLVVVLTAVFAIVWIALPPAAAQQHDLLISLFGVTGTMAALILPTAALFETFSSSINREITEKLFSKDDRDKRMISYVLESIEELQSVGLRTWRGSLYILCAFLLTILALLVPDDKPVVLGLPLQGWFMATTLAFLVVGFLAYCVTALWAFQFRALENWIQLLDIMQKTAEEQEKKEENDV